MTPSIIFRIGEDRMFTPSTPGRAVLVEQEHEWSYRRDRLGRRTGKPRWVRWAATYVSWYGDKRKLKLKPVAARDAVKKFLAVDARRTARRR